MTGDWDTLEIAAASVGEAELASGSLGVVKAGVVDEPGSAAVGYRNTGAAVAEPMLFSNSALPSSMDTSKMKPLASELFLDVSIP